MVITALGKNPMSRCIVLEGAEDKPTGHWASCFRWVQLKHSFVGGVLRGAYRIGHENWGDIGRLKKRLKVTPTVGDILKATYSGLEYVNRAEHNSEHSFIRGSELLPRSAPVNQLILAPCVFVGSKWCLRPLHVSEWMDIFDFQVKIKNRILNGSQLPAMDFRQSCPGKIIHRILSHLLSPSVVDTVDVLIAKQKRECHEDSGSQERCKRSRTASPPPPLVALDQSADSFNQRDDKAARSDDARVAVEVWNQRCAERCFKAYDPTLHDQPFDLLRRAMLRWYKRRIGKTFEAYLVKTYGDWKKCYRDTRQIDQLPAKTRRLGKELRKDIAVGHECVHRASLSTFWEWKGGSALYFWRWPPDYRHSIRDGLACYVVGDLPSYWARQRYPDDPVQCEKMREKLAKVCQKESRYDVTYATNRGYISQGHIASLTNSFSVPKGVDDIRMVYDATKSLLNAVLWAPNFPLPTIDTVLNNATMSTWFGDLDLGEMFLNYFLDEKLCPYAGVDVTKIGDILNSVPSVDGARILMRWVRAFMGMTSSPYNCTRAFSWGEDLIAGDRRDPSNPLRWDTVVLNLPGDPCYNPTLPWVFRIDSTSGDLAAFFITYIDDVRSGGPSEDICVDATHQVACQVNYLGQQDAARKRRRVSQEPGPWAGAMVIARPDEGLFVTCAQLKWDKTKTIIKRWLDSRPMEGGLDWVLDRIQLEKDRGFLVHITRTFTSAVPYLRRIHHTLESWREGRTAEGWKFSPNEWRAFLCGKCTDYDINDKEDYRNWRVYMKQIVEQDQQDGAPQSVKAAVGLESDLMALDSLFSSPTPVLRFIRGTKVYKLIYGFGDASGAGFGGSWEVRGTLKYRYGLWGSDMADSSSNFRELGNLTDMVEALEEEEDLEGAEIFVFTDNSTAERAFYNGTSSSKKLFELVLRLRLLETRAGCKIVIVHVAGTRMIDQGSDGLSRGSLSEGVMRGEAMISFIPLHQNAFEQNQELRTWTDEFLAGNKHDDPLEYLKPVDWFERGHDLNGGDWELTMPPPNKERQWMPRYKKGRYVWSPPPGAAPAALEQLRKSRHKRQNSTHLFICPRLLYPLWQRSLFRSADLILEIPAGHPAWPANMHEPLILAIYFPFISHRPWQLKRSPCLLDVEGYLQRMFKACEGAEGLVLRQLWSFSRRLASMSSELAWKVLQGRWKHQFSYKHCGKRRRSQVEEEEG
jgi:hypothetical protein